MKKVGILAGAFAAVALVCFLGGFLMQRGHVTSARAEADACRTQLGSAGAAAQDNVALLELYRARHEVTRANYGSAGDALQRAKGLLVAEGWNEARAKIDGASAMALKQEAGTSDEISAIIRALEAKGLPRNPASGS